MTNRNCIQLLSLLLSTHSPLFAEEAYRWQDPSGHTYYGDHLPENAQHAQALSLRYQPPLYEVNKVIDGDTIRVKNGGKVRLLGINAPEIEHRDRPAEPLGAEAHQRLSQLLQGRRVHLEFDQQRRDRFDRLLAHITTEDGIKVNELLLQEGLARTLFLQPNMRHLQRYYAAEAEAQGRGLGIWALPEFQLTASHKAEECIKRFCRLQGRVKRVERRRYTTTLHLQGRLRVAIKNSLLPQFNRAGIYPHKLSGKHISVRGWVGRRDGAPYLRLQHPLQIKPTDP